MNRALAWGVAAVASLAAHGALFAALWLVNDPDAVRQQDSAAGAVPVSSVTVRSETAPAAEAQGEAAPAAEGAAARVGQGPVSASRAEPLRPAADTARPLSDPAAPVAAVPPAAQAADLATPDVAAVALTADSVAVRPAEAAAPPLAGIAPPGAQAQALVVEPVSAAVSAAPETALSPAVAPSDSRVAAASAPADVIAAQDIASQAVSAALDLPATGARPQASAAPAFPVAQAQAPAAQVITAVDAPEPQAVVVLAMAAQAAPSAAPAPAAGLPVAAPAGQAVRPASSAAAQAPAAVPPATALPSSAPRAQTPAATRPPSAEVALAAPRSEAAQQPPLPAIAGKATLAWLGDGAARFDPVSLAAVQAFMAPTVAEADSEVRDGLTALLARVPCSRLQAAFRPEDGSLELVGHVPDAALAPQVAQALSAAVGPSIPVVQRLRVLPAPQCQALSRLDAVGLPQSTEHADDPSVVGADGYALVADLLEDDFLELRIQLDEAEYPAHYYVDYYDADGMVTHLMPNEVVDLPLLQPGEVLEVGTEGWPIRFQMTAPFNKEIAVLFSASRPLYDGVRPLQEPAAPYLDWLRARVAEARAADPDFKGEWAYVFVSPEPRGGSQ